MFISALNRRAISIAVSCLGVCGVAEAGRLSDELEYQLVQNVGFSPVTVELDNSYVSPVPICTYNLPSTGSPPVIPRIGTITGDSFQLSIQSLPNTDAGVLGNVHCLIAEEGTHTLPDGRRFQAITTVVSNVLGNNAGGWNDTVNISGSVSGAFTSAPAVLAAVISSNDARATAVHVDDCEQRQNEPFAGGLNDGICVGYHVGEQTDASYAPETVGVILAERGAGTVNNVTYTVARGPNSINGVGNGGGASYSVSGDFEVGVATLAGENGGQGGWVVLFGADPLPNNQVRLAIDEEVVAGDASRTHINEIVDYWLFRDANLPSLTLTKTALQSNFAEAGQTVDYEYEVENTGTVSISELDVTDDRIASVTCPVTTLAVGASTICTASDTVTPADVSAGSITNTALADGTPTGGTLAPPSDTVTITLSAGPEDIRVEKTISVFDPTGLGLFAIPGNDVIYTISIRNEGTGQIDTDTVFLVDALPPETAFFNGDVDGPGPETGRVGFQNNGTFLTFDPVSDVSFSDGALRPTQASDCAYTPSSGYDANVRFICFSPRGVLNSAQPDPSFSLFFRVRLQ
ncbi:MAG: hypothetical protein AAGJ29_02115 [Pseudomonadota bacterium]